MKIFTLIWIILIFFNLGGPRSAPRSKTSLDVKDEDMFPTLQGNNTVRKTVAPAARKVETPVWSKYQWS